MLVLNIYAHLHAFSNKLFIEHLYECRSQLMRREHQTVQFSRARYTAAAHHRAGDYLQLWLPAKYLATASNCQDFNTPSSAHLLYSLLKTQIIAARQHFRYES